MPVAGPRIFRAQRRGSCREEMECCVQAGTEARFFPPVPAVAEGAWLIAPLRQRCEQLEAGPPQGGRRRYGDGDGQRRMMLGQGVPGAVWRGSYDLRDRGTRFSHEQANPAVPAWINSGVLELVQCFARIGPPTASQAVAGRPPTELAAAMRMGIGARL